LEPLATLPPLSSTSPSVTLVILNQAEGSNRTCIDATASLLPVVRRSALSELKVQAVPVKLSPE
jgi:hypothetical protein